MKYLLIASLLSLPLAAFAQSNGPSKAAVAQAVAEDAQQRVMLRAQSIDLASLVASESARADAAEKALTDYKAAHPDAPDGPKAR